MLFNSIEFLLFLPVVFLIYWFVAAKRLSVQNGFLLAASYVFYGWWNWKFLFLLLLSTLIDYFFGLLLAKDSPHKKLYLWLSIINNLLVLGIFKYYNFFITEAFEFLSRFNISVTPALLKVALPVGISFYTFHGMSYVFDIYRHKVKPVKSFIDYALFVSFFPLLVAGPIERANHLLPQIQKPRVFEYKQALSGMQLIGWGLFKKVVLADNVASVVNNIFENYTQYSGLTLAIGAVLFAFQIYADFSGYSDIAIGSAKLFGFELLSNFRFPYFSRDVSEFWRRWHISLSSWFRDYLYIPLGGSQHGRWKAVRNTFIIFLVSGFWHGASWNFIVWGGFHAILFMPLLIQQKNRIHVNQVVAWNSWYPSFRELYQMVLTFTLVTIGWIFFRSPNLPVAMGYMKNMVSNTNGIFPRNIGVGLGLKLVVVFLLLDWTQRHNERHLKVPKNKILRSVVYILFMYVIWKYAIQGVQSEFIYFQF